MRNIAELDPPAGGATARAVAGLGGRAADRAVGAASWSGAALKLPVFYKILVATLGMVVLIAAGSTAIAFELVNAGSWSAAFGSFVVIAVVSAIVTLPAYALVLRFALAPLELLERAAEQVERGKLDTRAEESPLADPRLTRLTRVFNRLLDRVVADRERLREIAARAFDAQEAERTRIARELQEETAQSLSGVMLRLRVARRTPDAAGKDALLDEVRDELAGVAEAIRAFATVLQPPALTDLGVVAAIEAYARSLPPGAPEVTIRADDVRGLLSSDGELALYRIVQEAVTNALRHAHAGRIRIGIHDAGDRVEAVVHDDGRGFEADVVERLQPSLGLLGMRERALYAGGSVRIASGEGEGTVVRVSIPRASVLEAAGWAPAPRPERAT